MPPPASAFKKAPKKEETPLTAVLILDAFDQRFTPILENNPCFGFLPICNVPLINYTMSWLMRTEIENIMLVVSGKNVEHAKIVENEWKAMFNEFNIISCDGVTSVGDCLREIHNRELITSDFVLISNPSSITSSTLIDQIKQFRKRRQENADNVLTLIYGSCENRDNEVIGMNSTTKKLHLYPTPTSPNQLKTERAHFYDSISIRRDVVNSGIALCSRIIATQFSDNFDFLTLEDVIREILSKDDILGLNIHVEVLPSQEAAFCAKDYDSLLHLNNLLLERWFYPITPEKVDVSRFISVGPRNVYVDEADASVSRLSSRAVLGSNSVNVALGKLVNCSTTSQLINSSVDESSEIGENTTIRNCIIGKRCKIGSNCVLDGAFLADDVTIPNGTSLSKDVIVGRNVHYPQNHGHVCQSAVCHAKVDEDEFDKILSKKLNEIHIWSLRNGTSFWKKQHPATVSDDEDADDVDYSDDDTAASDPTKQFYEEVFESMRGVLTMSTQHMSNLILEINSSKLACNVTMDDVAKNVFAAFLALPGNDQLKNILELVKKWRPLFLNYYKASDDTSRSAQQRQMETNLKRKCQIQMLLAVEEKYEEEIDTFGSKVAKLVHFMYNDADILDEEAILEWADTIEQESGLKTIMQPIVDWLMEEDDEDEDEEEED